MEPRRVISAQRASQTKRGHSATASLSAVLALIAASACGAEPGGRPSTALLRLVPPDAAVVVTVDGLREEARAFGASKLTADLASLPAVKDWLGSDKYQQFEQSRVQIEQALGTNITELRDEIFGDAVVLALHVPAGPAADASLARGLLLVQARDAALLKRLINCINRAQQDAGDLSRIVDREHKLVTYHVREFPPAAGQLPQYYVDYADGTFAFTNSETLIKAVIDRKAPARAHGEASRAAPEVEPGLADQSRFKNLESRLPARGAARVFIDPRHLERSIAAAPPSKPGDVRLKEMLKRWLAAVDYAGAALEWSDAGITASAVETLKPSDLDPWLRRWAADARAVDRELTRVPATTVALAAGHLDAVALWDAVPLLMSEADQPKLANFETVLTGLLLGRDLRSKLLPNLGPGVVAYLDSVADSGQGEAAGGAPLASGWPFPAVIAVSVRCDSRGSTSPTVLDSIDNALRTVIALSALDEKRGHGRGRIVTQQVAGAIVTTLDFPIPFAYAIDRTHERVVLGTRAASVARYLECTSDPHAGAFIRKLQKTALAGAHTFACVNLDVFNDWASKHRQRLSQALAARQSRAVADVVSDLAHVLALARLFQAGFVTSRIDADASAAYQTIGLIRREQDGK